MIIVDGHAHRQMRKRKAILVPAEHVLLGHPAGKNFEGRLGYKLFSLPFFSTTMRGGLGTRLCTLMMHALLLSVVLHFSDL